MDEMKFNWTTHSNIPASERSYSIKNRVLLCCEAVWSYFISLLLEFFALRRYYDYNLW